LNLAKNFSNNHNNPIFLFCNNIIRFIHAKDKFFDFLKNKNIIVILEERINEKGENFKEGNNINEFPYLLIIFSF
jgi:hypothetical protein